MVEDRFTGRLLPAHLKPKDDELLSSWLVRLAAAHGVKPYTFWSKLWPKDLFWRKSRTDQPDNMEFLSFLSEKTGTSLDQVVSTTLNEFCGPLYQKSQTHGFRTWIMPQGDLRGVKSKKKQFSLHICPLCLAEDAVPYFRRSWRLSFFLVCPTHKVLLLDRCSHCGEPVNFYMNVSGEVDCNTSSFITCYNCRLSLRDIDVISPDFMANDGEVTFQSFLMDVLKLGWADTAWSGPIHSYLYFSGIYNLIGGLIRAINRDINLQEKTWRRYDIQRKVQLNLSKKNNFEICDIPTRLGLLTTVSYLLNDWPNEFIAFSKGNQLRSKIWLRKEVSFIPYWFLTVVNENLNHPKYSPSKEEIDSAINYIRQAGREPNWYTLSEYFNTEICQRILVEWDLLSKRKKKGACPYCKSTENQYEYGISPDGYPKLVCRKCKKKYSTGPIRHWNAYPEELRREAMHLYRSGVSANHIAIRLSISPAAVYQWARKSRP